MKPKEKVDVQKLQSINPKTLGKVTENSPPVEFINENMIRSSRDSQPIYS